MMKAIKILSAPIAVTLMITRRCNLRCLHCGTSPEQFRREDMTTKKLLSVIDELARCKVFRISVTGGEPLIHPHFFTIVNAIMQHSMRMQLDTNATLVTGKVVERLKELPRRPLISVSLDSIVAETYDLIRGPGSFINMKKGIRMLAEAGLRVRPFMVLSRLNYRELPQIVEFVKSIGIRDIFATMPTPCGRAPRYEKEMALQPNELRETLETILLVNDSNPGFLTGPWAYMGRFYRELKEGTLADMERNKNGTFRNCGAARSEATIASDGTVVPCDMSYTYRAGNVHDRPFVDIWRNSPTFNAIRECRGMPLAQVHGCEDCSWHHICRGPCPAGGYAMTGIWPAAWPVCPRREIAKLFGKEAVVQESRKVS